MQPAIIKNSFSFLKGTVFPPGDKSISHRVVFIGSIAKGMTRANNFLFSQDSMATIAAFRKMGVKITTDKKNRKITIRGQGLSGLSVSKSPLDIVESGTTMRILSGILSGQRFSSRLIADYALTKRPMRRIIAPLRLMGADISGRKIKREHYPPLSINGKGLRSIEYTLPVPSAQVKSAILFAGLYANGRTVVREKIKSRDHTERMLKLFGADINVSGLKISIKKSHLKSPGPINVPSDISSAAFFVALAVLSPRADLTIKSVGLNPTRMGIINVLKRMGADIRILNRNIRNLASKKEPATDIRIKNSKLAGVYVSASEVPSMIDELPILMVAASLADGKTTIEGVSELRFKETDRINSMLTNLNKMGAKISIKTKKIGKKRKEYIEIIGVDRLHGAKVKSFGDHRTAMSMIVAGLLAEGETSLDDVSCIDKSFPDFVKIVRNLLSRRSIIT